MLILYEGELLHTDSSTDVLEHYGMKGMKWWKRSRSAVESNARGHETGRYLKDYGKEYSKAVGRSFTNPILSGKAAGLASRHDLRKGKLASAMLVRDKDAMKRINDYIDDRRSLKGNHKSKQRQTKGVKNKVGNYVQYRHDVSYMDKKYAGRKGY